MGNCGSKSSSNLYGHTTSSSRTIFRRPVVLPSDQAHFTPSINSRNGWNVSDIYEFREEDRIGSGAFGVVFKGQRIDRTGNAAAAAAAGPEEAALVRQKVAIKKTTPSTINVDATSHDDIEEDCHEVRVLIKLSTTASPNVLHLYEYFWTGRFLYVVTEMLGMELLDWIKTKERIPETIVRRTATVLLRVVAHLHDHGIIHRDLKLQNVLFKRDGDINSLKVIDFGLARELREGESLTSFAGSYGYIAPELYRRQPYRFEVDMFAFGVMLFTMLSGGMRPFQSENLDQSELRQATLRLQYDVNQNSWDGITARAKALVRKLLIGREERLSAREALRDPWFSSIENSVIEVDHRPSVRPVAFEMPLAPLEESLAPNCYLLEPELRLPIEFLISQHVYSGRIVHRPNQHHLMMVEDVAPPGAISLPAYAAGMERYTELECRHLFMKVVSAVEQFHHAQVAHRYLTMTNIIIEPLSGMSCVRSVKYARHCGPNVRLTGHFGRRYCNFAFTAPEIDSEFAHDERVDIWSLGAILYTLLTGLAPFRGAGEQLVRAKRTGDVAFDEHFVASPQSQTLVERLMQPDPNQRLSIDEIWQHEWMVENDGILSRRDLSLPQIHLQAFA